MTPQPVLNLWTLNSLGVVNGIEYVTSFNPKEINERYFLFCRFCSIPTFPNSFLPVCNISSLFPGLIPRMLFYLHIMATSCPRAHLPTNRYLLPQPSADPPESRRSSSIPAAAASSSSSSGGGDLMSTLISCSHPFINVLQGRETSISILKNSRCVAIKPPGAAVMSGSLHVSHLR